MYLRRGKRKGSNPASANDTPPRQQGRSAVLQIASETLAKTLAGIKFEPVCFGFLLDARNSREYEFPSIVWSL